ncbi:unnamed protein product [Protopolystoma xenopodis]|uniref:Uncharacterized protein n=1 Tax=Protopolystoma xenopodis TaxID=117903 RepID=A0A448XMX4_9PLAT|nr:unnamed protein product [Protopolystoma xenopodis]
MCLPQQHHSIISNFSGACVGPGCLRSPSLATVSNLTNTLYSATTGPLAATTRQQAPNVARSPTASSAPTLSQVLTPSASTLASPSTASASNPFSQVAVSGQTSISLPAGARTTLVSLGLPTCQPVQGPATNQAPMQYRRLSLSTATTAVATSLVPTVTCVVSSAAFPTALPSEPASLTATTHLRPLYPAVSSSQLSIANAVISSPAPPLVSPPATPIGSGHHQLLP